MTRNLFFLDANACFVLCGDHSGHLVIDWDNKQTFVMISVIKVLLTYFLGC